MFSQVAKDNSAKKATKEEKIALIKQQIKNGTYKVNSRELALRLLSSY